jgi:hypothetical protein
MDAHLFIGSVRIGGIDAEQRGHRNDFERFVEYWGYARVVSMVWLNHTQRSMESFGALVYVTLRYTIDHNRLINRLHGQNWRRMRLHCEAAQTTNDIVEHHVERHAMQGLESRWAVNKRVSRDKLSNEVERFDRRWLREVAKKPSPGTLERYQDLATSKWVLALAMLGVRGKTEELVHLAHEGLEERSTDLKFMCANVGIDFLTGKQAQPPRNEYEALNCLREFSLGIVERAAVAPQRSTANETWYADLEEGNWPIKERNLVGNRRRSVAENGESSLCDAAEANNLTAAAHIVWYADELEGEESDWDRDERVQAVEVREPSSDESENGTVVVAAADRPRGETGGCSTIESKTPVTITKLKTREELRAEIGAAIGEQRSTIVEQCSAIVEQCSAIVEQCSAIVEQRSANAWTRRAVGVRHSASVPKRSASGEQRSNIGVETPEAFWKLEYQLAAAAIYPHNSRNAEAQNIPRGELSIAVRFPPSTIYRRVILMRSTNSVAEGTPPSVVYTRTAYKHLDLVRRR